MGSWVGGESVGTCLGTVWGCEAWYEGVWAWKHGCISVMCCAGLRVCRVNSGTRPRRWSGSGGAQNVRCSFLAPDASPFFQDLLPAHISLIARVERENPRG